MKLSEFRKKIEETIVGILNEEELNPQERVKDAADKLKQASADAAVKKASSTANPSPLTKQEVTTADAKRKAAEEEKKAADLALKEKPTTTNTPKKP